MIRSTETLPQPRLRGEHHPNAKLKATEVIAIRVAADAGATFAEIARQRGEDVSNIRSIVYGDTWKHVAGPIRPRTRKHRRAKLSNAEVIAIRIEADGGATFAEIARQRGLGSSCIDRIVHVDTYKHVAGPIRTRNPGRARGEDHYEAKLRNADVVAIRSEAAAGASDTELARRHEVKVEVISNIVSGKTYKHVPGIVRNRTGPLRGENHPGAKLSNAKVLAIRSEAAAGQTGAEIARRRGLKACVVSSVIRGLTYKEAPGLIRTQRVPIAGRIPAVVKFSEGTYRVFGEIVTLPRRAKGQCRLIDALIEAGESGLSTFRLRNVCPDYQGCLDRLRVPGSPWVKGIIPPDGPGARNDHWRIAYVDR